MRTEGDIAMEEKRKLKLNKLTLQVIAMTAMLIDHIGSILLPGVLALRVIGRLAFPIFAFFVAEGCEKTKNLPRYIRRMALFAVLSEVPFDFAHGSWWNPHSQNVLWTFLIAMLCIYAIKKFRSLCQRQADVILISAIIALAGFFSAMFLQTDYAGFGVWAVLIFWVCRDRSWRYSGELLGQGIVCYNTTAIHFLKTGEIMIPLQGFALFALPLIWLYDGEQGPHNRTIQYACYAFYPVHLILLGTAARLI